MSVDLQTPWLSRFSATSDNLERPDAEIGPSASLRVSPSNLNLVSELVYRPGYHVGVGSSPGGHSPCPGVSDGAEAYVAMWAPSSVDLHSNFEVFYER